ncbi:MAG: (2Fe-2S)-binding protein [Cellulosilyticaceae bacterium]
MSQLDQDIKDKLQKVCICKGIAKSTIKGVIREGAMTVEQVADKTGATQGGCKGHRCKETIGQLIETYKNGEWQ